MKGVAAVTHATITISPGSRFRAAMVLAMMADALQIVVFPLFAEGALSPADDVLDLVVAAVLFNYSAGAGNFCPHSLPTSCPESIWFPSGHLRSPMFIANGNRSRSPHKKLVRSTRR